MLNLWEMNFIIINNIKGEQMFTFFLFFTTLSRVKVVNRYALMYESVVLDNTLTH